MLLTDKYARHKIDPLFHQENVYVGFYGIEYNGKEMTNPQKIL